MEESSSTTTHAQHLLPSHTSVEITEISPVSDAAAAPPPLTLTNGVANYHRTSQGVRIRPSNLHEAMYRAQANAVANQDCNSQLLAMYKATLEGDYVGVQRLLREDQNLGRDEITEKGDRALPLAASMNHHEIVRKLLKILNDDELETLKDGNGYTACCHAAISGSLEIAGLLIKKNPTIATAARDRDNKTTPLQKAAMRGNTKMVLLFLESTRIEHLTTDEWFDLLLVTISGQMYGAALKILGIDEQLAIMTNNEGSTAFHVLAREKYFYGVPEWKKKGNELLDMKLRVKKKEGNMRLDMWLLAKKLWTCIQRLGDAASVLERMKNPSILHDAAEVGNVELITMLTHTYPHLVWHTNTQGYTLFHIAVKHRHACLFMLINEIGTRKDFIATSLDENHNNILHLAAELGPLQGEITLMPPFRMKWEMLWFEKVKAIVPPVCLKMKNKDGHTPRELFIKEHLSLMKESNTWMRATSDSTRLIATLLFGLVFASTFVVPGGYNQDTGLPYFSGTQNLTSFAILEGLAMSSAGFSIIMFWRIMIMCNNDIAPLNTNSFVFAHLMLFYAVLFVVIAFFTAYFLVYFHKVGDLDFLIILSTVSFLLLMFSVSYLSLVRRYFIPQSLFGENGHTLFKRHPACGIGRINEWYDFLIVQGLLFLQQRGFLCT